MSKTSKSASRIFLLKTRAPNANKLVSSLFCAKDWRNSVHFKGKGSRSRSCNLQMEHFHSDIEELLSYLTRLRVFFENRSDKLRVMLCWTANDSDQRWERTYTGTKGQPRFHVSKGQIEFLRGMHFSWEKSAELLGISTKP